MTNKYMYFVANWKMYGNLSSLNTLDKVIKFSKSKEIKGGRLIYCPPYTLISSFSKKFKNCQIGIGGQNCHESENYGAYTGSINSRMLKEIGANYVIIGHSENRSEGEDDILINKKIKIALKNKLNVIFCIGETLQQRKNKKTHITLTNQIKTGLKDIKEFKNIFIAYEPVWSIGTGIIPEIELLKKIMKFIKECMNKKNKSKNKKVKFLYGGSVNPNNIKSLSEINDIDGFLIGGASLSTKKFIDIVKKTYS
jgi:triosephosphate isomerase